MQGGLFAPAQGLEGLRRLAVLSMPTKRELAAALLVASWLRAHARC